MINLSRLPKQIKEKAISLERLDGGLNLWDLDYRLKPNESPEMRNMCWMDGALCSRDGQRYIFETSNGTGYACYEYLFWDMAFAHIGQKIYHFNPAAETIELVEDISSIPEIKGTFFRYGENLYYKTKGAFIEIKYDVDEDIFSAAEVQAYTPTIIINADPDTAAGDIYQPENRLSPQKTVWYNAKSTVRDYYLPVNEVDSVDEVIVDGEVKTVTTHYTVDVEAGKVSFLSAPPVADPPVNNTVQITYSKADTDKYNSVMDCRYASVYGGQNNVCVVLGGCPSQPNAYFWNGNHAVMDIGYYPFEHYNLAGDTEEAITGFGKQQNLLVIFKSNSIGKAEMELATVNERDFLRLPYTAINSRIGCDLPWSIQLVDNNLVFANTKQGVHVLLDSSAAYENNIVCISRKVNGNDIRRGLLFDMQVSSTDEIISFDDNRQYWVIVNGHAYLWNYNVSEYINPSWFYYTNIKARSMFWNVDKICHINDAGQISTFERSHNDYGVAIDKFYRFAVQNFGTYESLKEITKVIFAVRSDTASHMTITYEADNVEREDPMPIHALSHSLVPRDLTYRYLKVNVFSAIEVRTPSCKMVRHFTIKLANALPDRDMSIVSVQIFYKFQGRER